MEHLSVDEMIRFVSLTELNAEAVKLSASVTKHIRSCHSCLRQVRAFQMIYDEFIMLCKQGDFRSYAEEKMTELCRIQGKP